MNEVVITDWIGKMAFETNIDNHPVRMDADEDFGGTHKGPRPKPLVLASLAGCTGMDIISILGKKKVTPTAFKVSAVGELTDIHPKYYKTIHLTYEFKGTGFKDNPEVKAKIDRAIELSLEVYCGVSVMLKNSCEITHSVIILDQESA